MSTHTQIAEVGLRETIAQLKKALHAAETALSKITGDVASPEANSFIAVAPLVPVDDTASCATVTSRTSSSPATTSVYETAWTDNLSRVSTASTVNPIKNRDVGARQ